MSWTPNKPEHADRWSTISGVPDRIKIHRVLEGYAYPVNGNVGNPTPRFGFILEIDGKRVDFSAQERKLRTYVKENFQAYLNEVDGKGI